MSDAAQRQDRFETGQGSDLGGEKAPAGSGLEWSRPVFGGRAAQRIGYAGLDQREPVGGIRFIAPFSESESEQGGVKQCSGIIAGEGTAGAIGALQSRRQPYDEEARILTPEGWNGRIVPRRRSGAVAFAISNQAGTKGAVPPGFQGVGTRAPLGSC